MAIQNIKGRGILLIEPPEGSTWLNLGCGYVKRAGWINVDKYDICDPDVVHDLNVSPYPWPDNSVDGIVLVHVLEHLDDWWGCIVECGRILKPGAKLWVHVPDESSTMALTYRDHNHVFSHVSFHGTQCCDGWGTNAWAHQENDLVPLELCGHMQVPHDQYLWMMRWPFRGLLRFCADHLRNFIWEQAFTFVKIGDRDEQDTRLEQSKDS